VDKCLKFESKGVNSETNFFECLAKENFQLEKLTGFTTKEIINTFNKLSQENADIYSSGSGTGGCGACGGSNGYSCDYCRARFSHNNTYHCTTCYHAIEAIRSFFGNIFSWF
jgi:hypothetical protein